MGTMTNITETVPTLAEMNDAELVRLIPTLVYLGIISVTGIFGNSLVCHIYRTRYRLSNSQFFIICLSAIDLFSCFVVIPFEITTVIDQYTFEHLWLCKLSRFFNAFSTLSSSFLLLFIAFDRYQKVCKPFARQISVTVAKFFCFLAVLLGLVFAWPAVMVYGKKTFPIPEYGMVGTECSTDDSLVGTIFPVINVSVYGILFISGIVSIIVLYCLIGREVQKHVIRMSKAYKQGNKSVQMLSSSMAERGLTMDSEIDVKSLTRLEHAISKNKENNNGMSQPVENRRLLVNCYGVKTKQKELEGKCQNVEMKIWTQENDRGNIDHKKENMQTHSESSVEKSYKSKIQKAEENIESKSHNTDISDNLETDKTQTSNTTTADTKVNNPDSDKSNSSHAPSIISRNFSDAILNTESKPHRGRSLSVTSQASNILTRITSTIRRQPESSTGTFGKTQYLKQARATKTVFLMFMISLAFVLSYLPHLLLMLMRVLKEGFVDNMTDTQKAVYKFFLRSYFLNCAINPIIYTVCASRFRAECKELLNGICRRAGPGDV